MNRSYYSASLEQFCESNPDTIIGELTRNSVHAVESNQIRAWLHQVETLQPKLIGYSGQIYLEFNIPRMGKRIDVVLLINHVIFILEFKVGADEFSAYARDQVWDYALDLKNFHQTSHEAFIVPVLVATSSALTLGDIGFTADQDRLVRPIFISDELLVPIINAALMFCEADGSIDAEQWEAGGYHPTPTIIEAALSLYRNNSVEEISRSDAGAVNLSKTSDEICAVIEDARRNHKKVICFVTGVPGAGKTLVGLNIATKFMDTENETHSVFLSGNGPLVSILREALARNRVEMAKERGEKIRLGEARSNVKAVIQNVHHFRDEGLVSPAPPPDKVAIFDEAQRAWDLAQTASFMKRKKNRPNFDMSEPEFLISCMDRHRDWAVIVCLVGGGQEIHRGEAGIGEWLASLGRSFSNWEIHISPHLQDEEYKAVNAIQSLKPANVVNESENLHLQVSMRSFRAEDLSLLVKQILDIDIDGARRTYQALKDRYPIVLTRDVSKAREWLRSKARGSERYGIVVSSQAERLKPHAIDVKTPVDPVHWFLSHKDDVRSSYYLEDVATEFHVQGLELDWSCVTWDADFRFNGDHWDSWSFKGNRWEKIRKAERLQYHKNAYRVLLTRARQGMVVVVPKGDEGDLTRSDLFYDPTYAYLESLGLVVL